MEKIIILGGGSAGWMSASYLLKSLQSNIQITVIESIRVGRIGVGEATVPTIKTEFFDTLGLSEKDWMPHCNATYKMGVKFSNWNQAFPYNSDYYYHNFGEIPSKNGVPLTHAWIKKRIEENYQIPMDYACFSSVLACNNNKSPNTLLGEQVQHYAYHFDALLLADFLKDFSIKRGVAYVNADLVDAGLDADGNIEYVLDVDGKKYFADLFIDCSGFNAFLIEKILKEPKVTFEKSLLTDRAIALNIPEEPEKDGIRPYTTAQAMNAGWMWQIPLFNRSGNGYVYSSQFMSDDEAQHEMRKYFGKKAEKVDARIVKFQSYRREHAWVKNCVSIGLSSGFLEPLESTGIYFIYAALYQLVKHFPHKEIDPIFRDEFNKKCAFMIEDVKDFILMHFKTSVREDTEFWRANKYETQMSDSLKEILQLQKAGLPIKISHQADNQLYSSFDARFENFWTNSSYQCILCGVGYLPDRGLPILAQRSDLMAWANNRFKQIAHEAVVLDEQLPGHYEYLARLFSANKICI